MIRPFRPFAIPFVIDRRRTCAAALPLLLAAPALAAPDATATREKMRRFHLDPASEMNAPIAKTPAAEATSPLAGERDPIRAKAALRRSFLEIEGRGPIGTSDRAENLVDNGTALIRTPEEMERQGLTQARLAESPWSDDYWPIYKGILGARYADSKFPGSENWQENLNFVQAPSNLAATLLAAPLSTASKSRLNTLSPAEKYDLLLGDAEFPLTRSMWNEGRRYFDSSGKVETWMGICHGWAPAAYMVARPTRTVTLPLPAPNEGRSVTLYPSDLKGLASLLWATGSFEQKFIGGRCDIKDPKKDETTGRIIDPGCFDTNPGTFHLAVINQLGISRRSLVVDATYDYEVWNQPVVGYSYSHFNPVTGVQTATLKEAMIPITDYTNDKFTKFRSKKATHVVGIAFSLEYTVETEPSQRRTDSTTYDRTTTANYLYDLELDEKGRIVGGEWYTNLHPDFLWTAVPGSRAFSSADWAIDGRQWDGKLPLDEDFRAAAKSAADRGEPLAAIVEALIRLANP